MLRESGKGKTALEKHYLPSAALRLKAVSSRCCGCCCRQAALRRLRRRLRRRRRSGHPRRRLSFSRRTDATLGSQLETICAALDARSADAFVERGGLEATRSYSHCSACCATYRRLSCHSHIDNLRKKKRKKHSTSNNNTICSDYFSGLWYRRVAAVLSNAIDVACTRLSSLPDATE